MPITITSKGKKTENLGASSKYQPHPDNNIGKNNPNFDSSRHQAISDRNHTPHRSSNTLDNQNAVRISGKFKLEGQKPNSILYRQDIDGSITSYAVYDAKGMILKRVDIKGAQHGEVTTPHVLEYGRSIHPITGEIRVNTPRKSMPRKALPSEIQYFKEN